MHSSANDPSAMLTCGSSKPVWQPEPSVYYTLRVLKWNFVPLDPVLSGSWQYSPLVTAQQTVSEMKLKMDFCLRENSCKNFPNISPASNSFVLYQEILSQTVEGILGRQFPEREENASIVHQYLHLWPSEVKKKTQKPPKKPKPKQKANKQTKNTRKPQPHHLSWLFLFWLYYSFWKPFSFVVTKKLRLSIVLLQKWGNCKAESIWLWKLLFN